MRGQFAQLVLPGDNPDVASLVLEHENGALSTLNASYASASEYYLMNIYGKEATAYYDLHHGLSLLKRGEKQPVSVPCAKNDTFVEELEEFAAAARGGGRRKSAATMRPRRSRSSAPASCRRAKAAASRSRKSWRRIERRYLDAGIVAFRIGCHLAMSALRTAARCAGPRSASFGTLPPRSTRRFATAGSSSALSSAAAPSSVLPTRLLAISYAGLSADELAARLRASDPPIIARVENGKVLLDLRTVFADQDPMIAAALQRIAS